MAECRWMHSSIHGAETGAGDAKKEYEGNSTPLKEFTVEEGLSE